MGRWAVKLLTAQTWNWTKRRAFKGLVSHMKGADIRGQSPTIPYMLGNVAISLGILITASIHILLMSIDAYAQAGQRGRQRERLIQFISPSKSILVSQGPQL